jgi:phospholipid transport system substrate-binding protein
MNRRITLAALLMLPVAGISAASSSEEAQQRLHAAIDQVLGIAERASSQAALVDKVAPVLEKNISFVAMTRRAVGPGWRDFSGDQQKKAVSLFTKLVIRSYCNKFTLGEHPKIEYKSAVSPAAGRVDVTTTTIYKGNRYGVVYRMEQEDGWRATDIVIEGVSMVANYRSQFDPVFKKGGVEAVLSSLEQSVARQK